MPAGFENCRKNDGRIRTISGPNERFGLKEGEYMHVCFLGGKMYRGEVKKKKKRYA